MLCVWGYLYVEHTSVLCICGVCYGMEVGHVWPGWFVFCGWDIGVETSRERDPVEGQASFSPNNPIKLTPLLFSLTVLLLQKTEKVEN